MAKEAITKKVTKSDGSVSVHYTALIDNKIWWSDLLKILNEETQRNQKIIKEDPECKIKYTREYFDHDFT